MITRFNKAPFAFAWLLFFVYAAGVAFFLQLIVLPYILPSLHGGNGLLAGGDWLGFHEIAVELAQQIRNQGWSVWVLRPERHAPAGIAAALYAVTVSKPWVLIPINAALHATTGVVLMRIMAYLVEDWRIVFCSVLPFILYPSAMTWYTQIHKDGYYFAGVFLCLYGWIILLRLETWQQAIWKAWLAYVWIAIGIGLIWTVRSYGVQLMQGMGYIFALVGVIVFARRVVKNRLRWNIATIAVLAIILLPLLMGFMKDKNFSADVPGSGKPRVGTLEEKGSAMLVAAQWKGSSWLPLPVENVFYMLAVLREGYLTTAYKAGSNIDTAVHFRKVSDFIYYFPRALQIGLAAPFPTEWLKDGMVSANTVMKRISAVEMMVVYLALLFLPLALWRWRSRVEVWCTTVFCMILLLIYTYVTPNVGSLYRMRYGFLMGLVMLGVAMGLLIGKEYMAKKRQRLTAMSPVAII